MPFSYFSVKSNLSELQGHKVVNVMLHKFHVLLLFSLQWYQYLKVLLMFFFKDTLKLNKYFLALRHLTFHYLDGVGDCKLNRKRRSTLCDIACTTLWPCSSSSFVVTYWYKKINLPGYILKIKNIDKWIKSKISWLWTR